MVTDFNQLAIIVSKALKEKDFKLVTAESCTGGIAAGVVTSIEGSSSWFDRGFITYSNESKQEMLKVNGETIRQFGAVSEAVAKEMSEGALKQSHAQVSIAITGIAGPGGGSAEKPVGTVCFAWTSELWETKTSCEHFEGDRTSIREQAVHFALKKLLEYLMESV